MPPTEASKRRGEDSQNIAVSLQIKTISVYLMKYQKGLEHSLSHLIVDLMAAMQFN
jgi:hypothetical protein